MVVMGVRPLSRRGRLAGRNVAVRLWRRGIPMEMRGNFIGVLVRGVAPAVVGAVVVCGILCAVRNHLLVLKQAKGPSASRLGPVMYESLSSGRPGTIHRKDPEIRTLLRMRRPSAHERKENSVYRTVLCLVELLRPFDGWATMSEPRYFDEPIDDARISEQTSPSGCACKRVTRQESASAESRAPVLINIPSPARGLQTSSSRPAAPCR